LSKSVVPGDLVARGNYRIYSNVIKNDGEFYSIFVGNAEVAGGRVRVTRLSGPYIPKIGDQIIGMITDVQPLAATVDINSYINGYIMANAFYKRRIDPSKRDLSEKIRVGDLLNARVSRIERGRDVSLSLEQRWRVDGDAIFYISPAKAAYLLKSKSNIISKVKASTGAGIVMGINGVIVVKGEKDSISKISEAVKVIENHTGLYGLEDAIMEVLG
jgi:exosome complex component RRP4